MPETYPQPKTVPDATPKTLSDVDPYILCEQLFDGDTYIVWRDFLGSVMTWNTTKDTVGIEVFLDSTAPQDVQIQRVIGPITSITIG